VKKSAYKKELDRAVARILGCDERDVALITRTFMDEVSRCLADERPVCLSGFGKFTVHHRLGQASPAVLFGGQKMLPGIPAKHVYTSVSFSKAPRLKRELARCVKRNTPWKNSA